jgi:hypothetical protein
MNAERTIHAAVFALLLIGLWTVSGWVSYRYVDDIVLKLAAITLSWGIILLTLYVVFRRIDWRWWS